MRVIGARRLNDGRVVRVRRNHGLRKLCGCKPEVWAKCPHSWHFSKTVQGQAHRASLDRYAGKHIGSKTEAEEIADALRIKIRNGEPLGPIPPTPPSFALPEAPQTPDITTLDQVAGRYLALSAEPKAMESIESVRSIIRRICAFQQDGGERLGSKAVESVTEDDLELVVTQLRRAGRATSTVNHYVHVIKNFIRWAVRKKHLAVSPIGPETELRREKPNRRNRRLGLDEEKKLLASAGPWLQRLIIAALETGCRLGELLSLLWGDVNLKRRELVVRAENAKDGESRTIPISGRLKAVLEMAQVGPDGKDLPSTAFVFGNEVGGQVGSPRRAWRTCVLKAHGHKPVWLAPGALAPESEAAYRVIDSALPRLAP